MSNSYTVDAILLLLCSQMAHNLTQPDWVQGASGVRNTTVLELLDEIDVVKWDLKSGNDEMTRIRAGELLRNVMLNFEHAVNASTGGHEAAYFTGNGADLEGIVRHTQHPGMEGAGSLFTMYSGHDTTVSYVLHALGVFNELQPPYAAAIFLELYKDNATGEYIVEAYYRNSSNDPYQLNMPSTMLERSGFPVPIIVQYKYSLVLVPVQT